MKFAQVKIQPWAARITALQLAVSENAAGIKKVFPHEMHCQLHQALKLRMCRDSALIRYIERPVVPVVDTAILEISCQAHGEKMIIPILTEFEIESVIWVFEASMIAGDFLVQGIFYRAVGQQHVVVAAVRPAPCIDVVVEKGQRIANRRASTRISRR